MPHKTPEDKKVYNQRYYKEWYARKGRNRAVDYAEAIRAWKKNNPEAVEAYKQLRQAVRSGRVIRPTNCSRCGRESRLVAHHPDYTKPFEVLWLCSSCHKLLHLEATSTDHPRAAGSQEFQDDLVDCKTACQLLGVGRSSFYSHISRYLHPQPVDWETIRPKRRRADQITCGRPRGWRKVVYSRAEIQQLLDMRQKDGL